MRIQYISDLHFERARNIKFITPLPFSEISGLFLAGDLGNPFHQSYKDLLLDTASRWDRVFFVAGNHEYWNNGYRDVNFKLEELASMRLNLHFLNCSSVVYNGWNIAGGTLWSTYTAPKNAFQREINQEYNAQSRSISRMIQATRLPTIAMTHHLPSFKLVQEKFKTYNAEGWASHYDSEMREPVKIWICGHSHTCFNDEVNNVRVLINAKQDGIVREFLIK